MTIKITSKILQHLSKQIASGKVIWPLLTLNEYSSDQADPLIRALRLKAQKKIVSGLADSDTKYLYQMIFEGKKYADFSEEQKAKLKLIKEDIRKNQFDRKIVTPAAYSERKIFRMGSAGYLSPKPSSLWISRKRSYVFVNSTKREASSGD